MSIKKYIYWCDVPKEDGKSFAILHLMQGYCPVTLKEYKRLIAMLQEDFPQATEEDKLELSKVTESRFCKNFTLLQWKGFIVRKEYEGWLEHEGTEMEYGFT